MISWIKGLFSRSGITAIIAAIVALVAVAWRSVSSIKEYGAQSERLKADEEYKKRVNAARDAVRARDDVYSGRVPEQDADRFRRD